MAQNEEYTFVQNIKFHQSNDSYANALIIHVVNSGICYGQIQKAVNV